MRKYVTRSAFAEFDFDVRATASLAYTVFEADRSPRRTGLLDASGNPLFAIDEMEPIGFQRLKERS